LRILGFFGGNGTGGAAVLQWETRWFSGGARAVEDDVVRCKSPVQQRVLSRLRDDVNGVRWLLGWCEASGAADGGDCRGGGSRDNEGGRYSVSCGSSWRQLVSLLKWRRALRVSSFHGLV